MRRSPCERFPRIPARSEGRSLGMSPEAAPTPPRAETDPRAKRSSAKLFDSCDVVGGCRKAHTGDIYVGCNSRCTKSRSVPSQFMKPRGQWSPFVRVATKAVAKGFAVITDLRAFLSDSAADPCGAGSPEGCHLGVSARPGRDHSAHAWSPSSHSRREVEDPKRAEVLDLNVCSKAAFG